MDARERGGNWRQRLVRIGGKEGVTDRIIDTIQEYRGKVRVVGTSPFLNMPSHRGMVVGKDPEEEGYYFVALDKPAIEKETGQELPVIREAADNLRKVLPRRRSGSMKKQLL